MPWRPDTIAPAAMMAEIGALCAQVRQNADCHYGRLLRENVVDVLRCSFPGFGRRFGADRLEDAAGSFLADHHATRPQFHHIATEFVEFAQRTLALPQDLLSLLEYEWVLLSVAIDPADVNVPDTDGIRVVDKSSIEMNPTAKLVILPFGVVSQDLPADVDAGEKRRAYAVYRTSEHSVVSRPLTYRDCLLIDQIRSVGSLSFNSLAMFASNRLSEKEVRQWVADGAACCLLRLACHDQGDSHEVVPIH